VSVPDTFAHLRVPPCIHSSACVAAGTAVIGNVENGGTENITYKEKRHGTSGNR
jgi:hypothetical protein